MEVRVRTRSRKIAEAENEETAGYAKPPRHSQFKTGQSGNPRGRPRGSGGSTKHLRNSLDKTIPVMIDGKPTRVRREQAFYESLLRDALKGDNTARRLLIAEIRRLDESEALGGAEYAASPISGPADEEIIAKYREEVIAEFQKKMREAQEAEDKAAEEEEEFFDDQEQQ